MKIRILTICLLASSALAQQGTITFTNKTATFTNLEGRVFKQVELVRADLDGLIWKQEASGGRVCYTNLHPDVLESFGISSNRIDVALARAQHKAVADAQYRAASVAARISHAPTVDDHQTFAYKKGYTFGNMRVFGESYNGTVYFYPSEARLDDLAQTSFPKNKDDQQLFKLGFADGWDAAAGGKQKSGQHSPLEHP